MAWRSSGRKLSFEILNHSSSHEEKEDQYLVNYQTDPVEKPYRKKKKHKRKHKPLHPAIHEDSITHSYSVVHNSHHTDNGNIQNSYIVGGGGSVVCSTVSEAGAEIQRVYGNGELRQRNVNFAGGVETAVEENASEESGVEEKQRRSEPPNGSVVTKLETAESLDWNKLMADDPNYLFSMEKSPVKYFMDEMNKGISLRSTTTLGSEKERERVYDTIFRLPWRCELLIDVGFFVCLDSFLSLLTIMPTKILMILWRFRSARQFKKPSAAELSDIGCFIVLASGVVLLGQIDISLIYHMIRGQGTIKLYVVYNVLEIFDKLCQSFGGDVLQALFNSSEGLANCSSENMRFWILRFISDQLWLFQISFFLILSIYSFLFFGLTMAWIYFPEKEKSTDMLSFLFGSLTIPQAITLSTCIVAHNNALLALLVSNNFAEIKSNVFKRFSKDNIHSLVYSDSIERFHISAFLSAVLAQNILEAEGPWFESFLLNALMVFFCEMLIDIIKHSFLAKFNDMKPIVYSEFLEELCNQTLNIQTENTDSRKRTLTFIPLAPACVVIRVLTPVYSAHLPPSPLPWRLFWILFLSALTYVMLTSLKVMVGMGLQKHASWYVERCRRRKKRIHND
ncbi:LOW QUALITY PROTEIN: protein POLLEN DEFECTIVE IN GUIDANCE 1 [Populus alba x Populus x berolinensis]|nr:LOW QUALITY PROTEIN: protein POLLEN DEFECTIVE IN GUIDANCE 1 [Populus alba x Populus x berolinensis]